MNIAQYFKILLKYCQGSNEYKQVNTFSRQNKNVKSTQKSAKTEPKSKTCACICLQMSVEHKTESC